MPSAHAQAPAVSPPEIRAQRFTLVDSHGAVMGTFMARESTPPAADRNFHLPPRIVLLDTTGLELWGAGATGAELMAAP